jgi:hypothetical protein
MSIIRQGPLAKQGTFEEGSLPQIERKINWEADYEFLEATGSWKI